MYYKTALNIFLITIFILAAAVFANLYLYDPLQIWHKPYFRKVTYKGDIRETALPFIRDYPFNNIIIGNSLSANSSASEAGQKIGGKFFNLSGSGLSLYEKQIILNYILKRKKIDKIIFFLDSHYVTQSKYYSTFPVSGYAFLYDDNIFNDIKIYLNNHFMNCSLTWNKSTKCIGTPVNIDRPYSWEQVQRHKKRFGGLKNWLSVYKDEYQIQDIVNKILKVPLEIQTKKCSDEDKNKVIKYLYDYFITVVENNPQVNFYLIVPPRSNLGLASNIRDNLLTFEKYTIAIKYLVNENNKYNNLKIFAFDDLDKMGNIEDFKDIVHFRTWVNSYIYDSIRDDKNIITTQNVDSYLNKVHKKASSYNFDYYYNQMKIVKEQSK